MLTSLRRQHLQKLRKKDGGSGNGSAGDSGNPATTPKTPRKRAPAKAKTTTAKSGGKGKRKASEVIIAGTGPDSDEETYNSPTKKMKYDPGADGDSK
jgi:hypothetical protein